MLFEIRGHKTISFSSLENGRIADSNWEANKQARSGPAKVERGKKMFRERERERERERKREREKEIDYDTDRQSNGHTETVSD